MSEVEPLNRLKIKNNYSLGGTTVTGMSEWAIIPELTDPSISLLNPRNFLVPVIIKSTPFSLAVVNIIFGMSSPFELILIS